MPKRKWKGTLTKDLISLGHSIKNLPPDFKKGQKVICWKKSEYVDGEWTGGYEYHYSDLDGKDLVRTSKFLIEEYEEKDLD
ncbi:hypothetical protein SAMN04489761_3445 [Tenacibaculum sp. MAR_2009_124]|uniref:hypothetical protein n=1 Tax=Tenacibaculum sp. MAR_2009_124 TaxID=1250059 RepID=UPI00089AAA87|nr:hypothetical protein [Tenacibaculum sp. MAR_2009_124]SEC66649.1 hypothetical protein SAMN04489761_3445 [Tenacibaculum sp. MAR_2009_124]